MMNQIGLKKGVVSVTWLTLNFGAPVISQELRKLEPPYFAHR